MANVTIPSARNALPINTFSREGQLPQVFLVSDIILSVIILSVEISISCSGNVL